MDALYTRLRADARALDLDGFCQVVRTPALLLHVGDDEVEFVTKVGHTTGEFLDAGDEGARPTAVRFIVKSDRNPYADRISLGRTHSCDVVIRHPSVSKLHAHFLRTDDGFYAIRDVGSRNGVQINGRRIAPNAVEKLAAGDRLRIGAVEAQFLFPEGLYHALRQP